MAILDGCQEGKNTPKLLEICCPQCGNIMEIFAYMGGINSMTGRVVHDERCSKCGYVVAEGTPASSLTEAL